MIDFNRKGNAELPQDKCVDDIANALDVNQKQEEKVAAINKLTKKKRFWRFTSLASLFLFLVVILYACGSVQYSNTILTNPEKVGEPKPELEVTTIPTDEPQTGAESIQVYEYVIKAVGLTPDYTGTAISKGLEEDVLVSQADCRAYGEACSIVWDIVAGDDNFTASRVSADQLFISEDKSSGSFTNTSILNCDAGAMDAHAHVDMKEEWVVVEKDRFSYPLNTIGVILPKGTSKGDIQNGVSALLGKVNALQDNGQLSRDIQNDGAKIAHLSFEEMATMAADAFGGVGCTVSDYDGRQVFFRSADGKLAVESELLKDGDILVYFTLDRYWFTDTTAAVYSKILQGTYEGIVFDK